MSLSLFMFKEISLRKSPSTLKLSISFLSRFTSSSVRSLILVLSLIPVLDKILAEVFLHIPNIYVRPIIALFSLGKSTPAIRAMHLHLL